MKHVLAILGGIAIALVAAAIGVGTAVYQTATLERSSKAYLEANLPPILSTWSIEALLARAMPDLRGHAGELRNTFQELTELGSLKQINIAQGQTPVMIPTNDGKRKGAVYTITVNCQKGEARITLWLIKVRDNWKFQKFAVKSPVLQPARMP